MQEEEWFHGVIDRNKVEMLLKNEGDYLVRESNTKAGQFVLSAKYSGKARHFIIQSGDVSRQHFIFIEMRERAKSFTSQVAH